MLALIAGTGALPQRLASAQPVMPLVCSLEGFTPDTLAPDILFRLETLGSLLAELKDRGVSEVCFAGAIRRPEVDPRAIDALTMPLVPVIQKALGQGDDGALRAVLSIFEREGFVIKAAEELAPELIPPAGVLGRHKPSSQARHDVERAEHIMRTLSQEDVGQACVVKNGQVLAIEGVFGTDWMLDSLAHRPDGRGGVFFKSPKAGQDRRADLPLIGLETVAACARAGLEGLVIEAGGVLLLDAASVIETCDAQGMFLWIRERTV